MIMSASSVGQRSRVIVTGPGRKLRKKQRRSRSPLLYPAVDPRTGRSCWLRLKPGETFAGKANSTEVDCVVTSELPDGKGSIAEPIVGKKTSPEEVSKKTLPANARLLSELVVGEQLTATVARKIGPALALVSTPVYRRGQNGVHHRIRAVLRLKRHETNVDAGDELECYVKRPEPNSGKLTLSSSPVTTVDLKRQKNIDRLRKQIKRGTLRIGCTRVATVTSDIGGIYVVDAGGLRAELLAESANGETLHLGDRLWVRVLALPSAKGPAKVQRLTDEENIIRGEGADIFANGGREESSPASEEWPQTS